MRDIKYIFIFFILFSVVFYSLPFKSDIDFKFFLTVATFLFAIFSGFLISRQGTRYSAVRDDLNKFDGYMSFIYRASGHFGEVQKEIGEILKKHYTPILESKTWHYSFTNKTTTMTDIHSLYEKAVGGKNLTSLQSAALSQTLRAILECQSLRKNMISLYQERIPLSQWLLLGFLVFIILFDLLMFSSHLELLSSLLKGAFGAILIFVLILIRKFDRLEFFESMIGENSARDVLDIINGRK
jgi:hypothetical protein